MMLNVVVAILLDEFIATVTQEKEEAERLAKEERDRRKITGSLDAVAAELMMFENQKDLDAKISALFLKLDEDASGGLTFEELSIGLRESYRNVHLTHDDFDLLSEHGMHLGPGGEFNSQQFHVSYIP